MRGRSRCKDPAITDSPTDDGSHDEIEALTAEIGRLRAEIAALTPRLDRPFEIEGRLHQQSVVRGDGIMHITGTIEADGARWRMYQTEIRRSDDARWFAVAVWQEDACDGG